MVISTRSWMNPTAIKTAGLVGLLVLLMGIVIGLQQAKLRTASKDKLSTGDYQRQARVEEVKVDVLKNLPALGFKNLLADWAMLQFIQYYGDVDARDRTGYKLSPDYLEAIVNNDPYFVRSYLTISPASSINAGRSDRTIALMDRGLKSLSPSFKDAYYIWLYKGVDELLFQGDTEAAKHSNKMAADWAKIAGNTFIEKSARQTLHFLENNPKSRKPQVGAWLLVWANTWDKDTRKLAQDNIKRLGGQLIVHPNGLVEAIPPKEN